MKDLRQTLHQMQEVNQKLTESMADSREEVQNLTLAMKNLEMQNIQQRKWMEDMVRKMAKEMKSLENKMVKVKATPNDEETRRPHFRSWEISASRQSIPTARREVFSREVPKRDNDRKPLGILSRELNPLMTVYQSPPN